MLNVVCTYSAVAVSLASCGQGSANLKADEKGNRVGFSQ
jgi:hypothetical protein